MTLSITIHSQITDALKHLDDAKRDLMTLNTQQANDVGMFAGVLDQKTTLEKTVEELRQEKEALEQEIETLKRERETFLANNNATTTDTAAGNDAVENQDDSFFMIDNDEEDAGDDSTTTGDETSTTNFMLDNISMIQGQPTPSVSAHSSLSTGGSRTSTKKRHPSAAKAKMFSPKKWRRMIRTHRLQSILLTN